MQCVSDSILLLFFNLTTPSAVADPGFPVGTPPPDAPTFLENFYVKTNESGLLGGACPGALPWIRQYSILCKR